MNNKKQPKIKYFDLYGLRKKKYEFLENFDVKNTKWQKLELKEPYFWFVPKDTKHEKEHQKFISVKDIFIKYNTGIATGKDEILVNFNKQSIIRKLSTIDRNTFELLMQGHGVNKDLIFDWYKELKNKDINEQIQEYNYRIFDKRYVIYNNKILQRSRSNLMNHLLKDNLTLVTTKILSSEKYKHIFVSNLISDRCYMSNKGREANYFFPLYLYQKSHQADIFSGQKRLPIQGQSELDEREVDQVPNIKKEIFDLLKSTYNKIITPEEIFYYIYAVLYSDNYRKKYNEFLKIDFPRVPFTKDYKLFRELSILGKWVVDLHLLKSPELNKPIAKFEGKGDNKVELLACIDGEEAIEFFNIRIAAYWTQAEKPKFKSQVLIKINNTQCFIGVPKEIWEYNIGGYQVLHKWLKDRSYKKISRGLNDDEIRHYLKVITTISKTIKIQKEIDKIYPEIEKNLIK